MTYQKMKKSAAGMTELAKLFYTSEIQMKQNNFCKILTAGRTIML